MSTKYPLLLVHGIVLKDVHFFKAFGKIESILTQHGYTVSTSRTDGFGSIENVWKEKSQILAYAKKTVCRRDLADTEDTIPPVSVKNAHFGAMASAFELSLYGEWIPVRTKLLGKAGAENIALAASSLGLGNVICGMAGMVFSTDNGEKFKTQIIPAGYEFGVAVLVGEAVNPEGTPHVPDMDKIVYL